jgi:ketosteroid isomerase-like protein
MNHVELFEAGMKAFNEGDAEAFLEFCDPDCEWYPFLNPAPGGGPYRGREGLRGWLRTVSEQFDRLSTRVAEVIDLPDRIVALGEIRYRSRGSELEASAPIAWLVDFRDELVWRGRVFMRHEDALEEAGLAVGSLRPTR